MKHVFNKVVSSTIGIIMIIGILMGMTIPVSAVTTVTHRIIANGTGYNVFSGASGGSQVGTYQTTLSGAVTVAVNDGAGGKVIQFGDGTTPLFVPTDSSYYVNSLETATYTGKVTSSGNLQYLLGVKNSAQVVFVDIEITNNSIYYTGGNRSKAIYITGVGSKLTIDGANTLIRTIAAYSTAIFNNNGTVNINDGTIKADTNYAYAVSNTAGIINISGGSIKAAATGAYGVYNASAGIANITGGTVEVTAASGGYAINTSGAVNISGGEVRTLDSNSGAIAVSQSGICTINISGMAKLSSYSRTISNNGGTINITGGTVQSSNIFGSSITSTSGTINVNTNGKVTSKSAKAILLYSIAPDDTAKLAVYGVTVWNKKGSEISVRGALNSSTNYYEISSMNGYYGIDKGTLNVSYMPSYYTFDKWATSAARDTAVNNSAKQMVIGSDNDTFYPSISLMVPAIPSGQQIKQGGALYLSPISNMSSLKLQTSKDDLAFTDLSYTANQTTVILPETLEEGTYKLFLFLTSDSVHSAGSTNVFTVDNTGPATAAGEISRSSYTNATVKFTSNESGTYYYGIVEHGAGAPAIDTGGAGSTCTTSETTINLTSLVTGAKDIYIKVKDKAGNVSDALEIDIAQYIPPAATPTGSVTVNNGTIKKNAEITLSSEVGATIYYTAALNGATPDEPTTLTPVQVSNGGAIDFPALTYGDVLKIKAIAAVPGKPDSAVSELSYTVQSQTELILTGITLNNKEYDGNTDATVTGGSLEGSIVTGDDVTLVTSTVVGQFEDKKAGTNKIVTLSGYTLEGIDAMYYDLTQPNLTADIQKKNIAVSSIAINDKVYDGSEAATIVSITLNWKAAGDDVYAQIPAATAVFSDASTGYGKNVSVTGLELAGADAGNYQLTTATVSTTGNILLAGMVAIPTVSPTEESILSGTNVTLTTTTNGATIYYTLDGSEPTGSSDIYNGSISVTGNPGAVVTVKAMAVKTGMVDSGTITKQYTIAEPGSLIITAVPNDQIIMLSWNEIPDTVTYAVYSGDDYLGDGISVTDSVYGYNAMGLTNGIPYTFTVNAMDSEQRITNFALASATPRTIPGAPTDVKATAGNGQAIIGFTVPADNGGSDITGYIVTSSPGDITVNGTGSPITITGLTNGTMYTFTVKAINVAGNGQDSSASNVVIPYRHSNRSDSEEDSTPITPTEATKPGETGAVVLVNGKAETAATATTTKVENRTVLTLTLDDKKVEEKLQEEGNNTVVTISFNSNADVAACQLNGQTVKNMEIKEAVLEIKTEGVTYTLPASEINIDNVLAEFGGQVELKDIKININIAEPLQDIVRIVEDTANRNNYQIVVKPIEFEITCSNGDKIVNVSKFNGYIERTIAIPEGIDPMKITTGVVLNEDGTFSHVPTQILVIDGKYYAKINSLTNSTYSIIWNPKNFKDVETHWAKEAIDDMCSRLVISGIDEENFAPDREITRGEFAAIVVRSLGLKPGTGTNPFTDVKSSDWYCDYIKTALEYKLISGYGADRFGPADNVTREQAMTIIARAMCITGLRAELETSETEKLLDRFTDSISATDYAKNSIAACIKTGIVPSNWDNLLTPKDNITRAEVAAIVQSLLKKSGLI